MKTYAIDFETYYDKDVSIKPLGTWHYLRHPDCEVYMVSIVGPDIEFCGNPKDAPWSSIAGSRWVAHNYAFDGSVIEFLREKGVIKEGVQPADYNCTANLAAYMKCGRSLKDAAKHLLGVEVSKDPRDYMKGRRWSEVPLEKRGEIIEYALNDSRRCLELWNKYSAEWPEIEQWASKHTLKLAFRGIQVDVDAVREGIIKLRTVAEGALARIPWIGEGVSLTDVRDKSKKITVLSHGRLALECAKVGISAPKSMSEDDEECQAWEQKYGDQFPWVAALREYRKSTMYLDRLEKIRDRLKPDGTMAVELLYYGAHTGRWSGTSGFNFQNQSRKDAFGVDLRGVFIPRKGYKFCISDLSQIEPRVLNVFAGNWKFIDAVKEGYNVYEAMAVAMKMWSGEKGTLKKTNPVMYQAVKAIVLGAGYGMGVKKFIVSAPILTGGAYNPTEVQAEQSISSFRELNPMIPDLWRKMDREFKKSLALNRYDVVLPSWRSLKYFDIAKDSRKDGEGFGDKWTARNEYGKPSVNVYGARICENITQATARDVLLECMKRIEDMGYNIVLHVHDEVVVEIKDDSDAEKVAECMRTAPAWISELPLGEETHVAEKYGK